MSRISRVREELTRRPRTWLITGVAGFIGSNVLEELLSLDQHVTGLDNFATGHRRNLDDVRARVGTDKWSRFKFVEGDIADAATSRDAARGVDIVLHQAALGSVPRSIEDPLATNRANIDGFLNMLVAAKEEKVGRFVYAASSSTYGDHPALPKVEEVTGRPLSPYAVTKLVNELYAEVFARAYGTSAIGLRYFNVFGPRQDPGGAYAAVVPKWVSAMLAGSPTVINGDGETSRDFCYVSNAVQANLLAGVAEDGAANQVYNVAVGERTTLNSLHALIRGIILARSPKLKIAEPEYRDFRAGDVRHSLASIEKAKKLLGYEPTHSVVAGLNEAMDWYIANL